MSWLGGGQVRYETRVLEANDFLIIGRLLQGERAHFDSLTGPTLVRREIDALILG